MAIQPIDLQILFTQVEKVGKAQSAQREGLAIHQDIQGVQLQRKMEEHIRSVNEAQNTGDDGAEKVKDQGSSQGQDAEEKKKGSGYRSDSEDEPEPEQATVLNDPRLGRNIDISY